MGVPEAPPAQLFFGKRATVLYRFENSRNEKGCNDYLLSRGRAPLGFLNPRL